MPQPADKSTADIIREGLNNQSRAIQEELQKQGSTADVIRKGLDDQARFIQEEIDKKESAAMNRKDMFVDQEAPLSIPASAPMDRTLSSYFNAPRYADRKEMPGIYPPGLMEGDPIKDSFIDVFHAARNLNATAPLLNDIFGVDFSDRPEVKPYADLINSLPTPPRNADEFFLPLEQQIKALPNGEYFFGQFMKRNYDGAESSQEILNSIGYDAAKNEYARTLSNARGFSGFAASALGDLADPITLPLAVVPFGQVAKGAGFLSKMVRGATAGASAGAAYGIAKEAIWQNYDPDRTADESLSNIVMDATYGAGLGGLLGAGSGAASFAARKISQAKRIQQLSRLPEFKDVAFKPKEFAPVVIEYTVGKKLYSLPLRDSKLINNIFTEAKALRKKARKTGEPFYILEYAKKRISTEIDDIINKDWEARKSSLAEELKAEGYDPGAKPVRTGETTTKIENATTKALGDITEGDSLKSVGQRFIKRYVEEKALQLGVSPRKADILGSAAHRLVNLFFNTVAFGTAGIGAVKYNNEGISSIPVVGTVYDALFGPSKSGEAILPRLKGGKINVEQEIKDSKPVKVLYDPLSQAALSAFEPISQTAFKVRDEIDMIDKSLIQGFDDEIEQAYVNTLNAEPQNLSQFVDAFLYNIKNPSLKAIAAGVLHPLRNVTNSRISDINGKGGELSSFYAFDYAVRALMQTVQDSVDDVPVSDKNEWAKKVFNSSATARLMAGRLLYDMANIYGEPFDTDGETSTSYVPLDGDRAISFAALLNEMEVRKNKTELDDDERSAIFASIPTQQILAMETLHSALKRSYGSRYPSIIEDTPFQVLIDNMDETERVEK